MSRTFGEPPLSITSSGASGADVLTEAGPLTAIPSSFAIKVMLCTAELPVRDTLSTAHKFLNDKELLELTASIGKAPSPNESNA